MSRFATYDEFPDMEFKKVKIIKKTKVGEAKPTRNKNKFYFFFRQNIPCTYTPGKNVKMT
jgi:hypothetical protein